MDDSFVPVIPDIKDQNLAPPLPTSFIQEACPEPSTSSSWFSSWSWSSCSNVFKIAVGFMVICLLCILAYIGYLWMKGDTKKEEKKEEPKKEPDMDEIMKTRNLLKKRKEDRKSGPVPNESPIVPAEAFRPIEVSNESPIVPAEAFQEVPIEFKTVVIDMTPTPTPPSQSEPEPEQSRFEVVEEAVQEKKDEIDEFLE